LLGRIINVYTNFVLTVVDSVELVQRIPYQGDLEGLVDFKIGQVIRTVKYADDLVLLSKTEAMLQGMTERQIEIGRCYGMEMNMEKTKVMRISRQ
jgi:hypothetical protein